MALFISILLAISLLLSGIFAVTNSLPMQSVAVLLTGLACLISVFTRPKLLAHPYLLLVGIIGFLYFTVRAYLSPVQDLGTSDLFLLLPAGGLYFLCSFGYVSMKRFFWIIVSVILVLAGLNLLMFLPVANEFRDSILPFARGNDESGLYNHRNFCSNLLMMAMLISFSVGIWFKELSWARYFYIMMGFGFLLGLTQAPARGAIVAAVCGICAIGILFIITVKGNKVVKIKFAALIFIILVVAFGVGLSVFSERYTKADIADLEGRRAYFAMAIDQVVDAPMLGSGSMSYSYLSYLNWGDHGFYHQDHVWVHNEFLQVLCDYGVVGLLIMLVFFLVCIFHFCQVFEIKTFDEKYFSAKIGLRAAGISVFLGFCVNCIVSFPGHAQPNLMVFAFAVVLLSLSQKTLVMKSAFIHISRLLMIVIIFLSMSLGYKEARALVAFGKQGIFVDTYAWEAGDHLDDGWKQGLEDAVEVAPTYLRYERLSSLLLADYDRSKNKSIDDIKEALRLANLSLDRHPYYAVSMSNRARCLELLGQYREADVAYEKLVKYTNKRQLYFKPFTRWARMCYYWGVELESDRSSVLALEAYRSSWDYVLSAAHRDGDLLFTMSATLYSLNRLEMRLNHSKDLENRMQLMYGELYKHPWQTGKVELLKNHTHIIYEYAKYLYMNRRPSEALKWYEIFRRCSETYARKKGTSMGVEMLEMKQQAARIVKLLKRAKVTPAP